MDIAYMEPMLPEEGLRDLEDSAASLLADASALAGRIHPLVRDAVGDLVRSMNCYYSNLIEGHDTHPRDIDRALANDFSSEPRQRDLQLEALAHIHVQGLIDQGQDPDVWPATATYARWLHEKFCERLPEEMLWVENELTGERVPIVPGRLRTKDVKVGRHIPPPHGQLPRFLARFDQAYNPSVTSRIRQIQAVGAVHHRFLWIHPFLDGNGRVARLMSHALLKRLGVGTSLWSVARGLARDDGRYKQLLIAADRPRDGDRDGRGNLSQSGLNLFAQFFLDRARDQVSFMGELLDPAVLLRRVELYVEDEIAMKKMPRGRLAVLREVLLNGEIERGRVPSITGYEERAARMITSSLVDRGMLVSTSSRAPLRLGLPADVAERWFPRLYPIGAGGVE
jgi:Fic family protein